MSAIGDVGLYPFLANVVHITMPHCVILVQDPASISCFVAVSFELAVPASPNVSFKIISARKPLFWYGACQVWATEGMISVHILVNSALVSLEVSLEREC
jgi:hypothetical protein